MHIRKYIIAILSLLTVSLPLKSSAQINTDQVLQIGCNALYFEDYVIAIQYFNQVIAAKPYLAKPYFFRAWAKMSLDDMQGAEADATLAIERNPFITDAYELRGAARQNQGKSELAIEDFDRGLSQLPNNRALLFNKAMAQESIKDYDGAKDSFARLLSSNPIFDGAYIGRARLNIELGDTTAAINDINKAIKLNPNASNAYILRANILINQSQDYRQALDDMDKAIRLLPRQSELYVNRAFLRYKLDDYFGAMADYDYALQLDPFNLVALFNRSLLRTEVRDFNNALNDLNQILSLRPSDLRALYNRAQIKCELRDYNGAMSDANRLIEAFPDLSAAYLLRYEIRQRMADRGAQKDLDKSIALGQKRIRKLGNNPSMVEVLNNMNNDEDLDESEKESQEYVAKQFTQLITLSDNTDIEQEFNNKNIRGRVQDRNIQIEPEPIYTITYYTSPTELKPTGDYMKQIDDVNRTHALNYILQLTNHEATLTDSVEIARHFESIDYYNSYLASHTPRAIDYFGRAMNQMTLHNYSAATSDFKKALKIAPDFAIAQFMIGVSKFRQLTADEHRTGEGGDISLRQARYRDVVSDFEETLKIAPDMSLALYNMGVVYIALREYTSALEAFTRAISMKPDFGEAYFNRGYVNYMLGQRSQGSSDLSKAGQLGIAPSYNLLKRMTN